MDTDFSHRVILLAAQRLLLFVDSFCYFKMTINSPETQLRIKAGVTVCERTVPGEYPSGIHVFTARFQRPEMTTRRTTLK